MTVLRGFSQTVGLPGTASESEGSEEPSPLSLATEGFPSLELTGVVFRIDQYVPSFTTSDTTSELVGGFSALTTPEKSVSSSMSQTMPGDNSGDPDDHDGIAPHLTSGGGTVSVSASRAAHLILVLHADRGFTTDVLAGVSWSVRSSSLDSRNMQVEASASTSTTPNPQYTDPTWLEDGSVLGRTDDPEGPVPVPRNYGKLVPGT